MVQLKNVEKINKIKLSPKKKESFKILQSLIGTHNNLYFNGNRRALNLAFLLFLIQSLLKVIYIKELFNFAKFKKSTLFFNENQSFRFCFISDIRIKGKRNTLLQNILARGEIVPPSPLKQ